MKRILITLLVLTALATTTQATILAEDTGDIAIDGSIPNLGDQTNAHGWVGSTGNTYSNTQVANGSLSLYAPGGIRTQRYYLPTNITSGNVSMQFWIYDNGDPTSGTEDMGFVTYTSTNITASGPRIGMYGDRGGKNTNYTMTDGMNCGGTFGSHATNTLKTTGWHRMRLKMDIDNNIIYYQVDGNVAESWNLATCGGYGHPVSINGIHWHNQDAGGNIMPVWYDNIRIWTGNWEDDPALFTHIISWENQPPQTNTFTNQPINFNYTITKVDGTDTCTLYKNGQANTTQTGLGTGNHTLTYTPASDDSAIYQYHISCTDNTTTVNTTTKTIRVDLIQPAIMSYTPLIDNTTKVDTKITLNITIMNDFMNNSHINITGGGDTYYNSSTAAIPNHNYHDTINTSTWTQGTKQTQIFGDDQLQTNQMTIQFEVCHPTWTCNGYATCTTNDTKTCNSVQDTNCAYNPTEYTGNYTEFPPITCNYCTSTWTNTNTTCTNQQKNATYTYSNTCCADTGLPSDCNIPPNQTNIACSKFEFSDTGDLVSASLDTTVKLLIAGGIILILGAILVIIITLSGALGAGIAKGETNIIKKMFKK